MFLFGIDMAEGKHTCVTQLLVLLTENVANSLRKGT